MASLLRKLRLALPTTVLPLWESSRSKRSIGLKSSRSRAQTKMSSSDDSTSGRRTPLEAMMFSMETQATTCWSAVAVTIRSTVVMETTTFWAVQETIPCEAERVATCSMADRELILLTIPNQLKALRSNSMIPTNMVHMQIKNRAA